MPNPTQGPRATGTLTVVVHTAGNALPVPGAYVTVSTADEEGDFSRTVVTDESGRAPTLILETPPASASLTPGGARPYAVYSIRTEKEGFYTNENSMVPLFAGVNSVQPVELLPRPPYESENIQPMQNTDFTSEQQLNS